MNNNLSSNSNDLNSQNYSQDQRKNLVPHHFDSSNLESQFTKQNRDNHNEIITQTQRSELDQQQNLYNQNFASSQPTNYIISNDFTPQGAKEESELLQEQLMDKQKQQIQRQSQVNEGNEESIYYIYLLTSLYRNFLKKYDSLDFSIQLNEGSYESNQGVLKSKRVRKTGAQCPWGFAQIFALIILGLNFLATIILDLPSLACALEDFGLFLFAVQVVLQISSIVVAVICASKDPTDPIIYEQRALKVTGQDFNDENFEYFCDKCDAHVNDNTKHCNRCNRCTKEFDHHCIWLNNCVGYNNYRVFCILIGIMMAHAILAFIIKIYLCAKVYGSGASDFEVQTNLIYYYQKYLGISPHQNSLMAFGVSIGVLNFMISLAMTYLVVYHIWLKIHGLTTYQHILLQRERANKMRQSYLETCDDIEEINEQYSNLLKLISIYSLKIPLLQFIQHIQIILLLIKIKYETTTINYDKSIRTI